MSARPPTALPDSSTPLPARVALYPELRYMGSKHRLLPWIHEVLSTLEFDTAADPFAGSGCVAYLLKAMGKSVRASDFLNFPTVLAAASVGNSRSVIDDATLARLLAPNPRAARFIEETFAGIFYTRDDLEFLDRVSANIDELDDPPLQALARSALIRSCLKRQPRGVFTISGDLARHDDGRRDLRMSLEEHFPRQVAVFNQVVFDNGREHLVQRANVFDLDPRGIDLVYLDPPYVPRSDDNCYVKRYHFVEGLSCYWRGMRILERTRVKKIEKLHTPFSYRRAAVDAFDRLFAHYRDATIVLSYGSNGYPDLAVIGELLARHKGRVDVFEKPHRYHFGTHEQARRRMAREYLIVGR